MDEIKSINPVDDARPVNGETLHKFNLVLGKYKAAKNSVERRAIAAENWWKLRNKAETEKFTDGLAGFNAKSGWLHNVTFLAGFSNHCPTTCPIPCLPFMMKQQPVY